MSGQKVTVGGACNGHCVFRGLKSVSTWFMEMAALLTKFLAQVDNSIERFDGEVDPAVQVPQVGQLDP